MRYVIFFAAIGFFLVWDVVYNQGQYIDYSVRVIRQLMRHVIG